MSPSWSRHGSRSWAAAALTASIGFAGAAQAEEGVPFSDLSSGDLVELSLVISTELARRGVIDAPADLAQTFASYLARRAFGLSATGAGPTRATDRDGRVWVIAFAHLEPGERPMTAPIDASGADHVALVLFASGLRVRRAGIAPVSTLTAGVADAEGRVDLSPAGATWRADGMRNATPQIFAAASTTPQEAGQ